VRDRATHCRKLLARWPYRRTHCIEQTKIIACFGCEIWRCPVIGDHLLGGSAADAAREGNGDGQAGFGVHVLFLFFGTDMNMRPAIGCFATSKGSDPAAVARQNLRTEGMRLGAIIGCRISDSLRAGLPLHDLTIAGPGAAAEGARPGGGPCRRSSGRSSTRGLRPRTLLRGPGARQIDQAAQCPLTDTNSCL
jgi:hypothetical protein